MMTKYFYWFMKILICQSRIQTIILDEEDKGINPRLMKALKI